MRAGDPWLADPYPGIVSVWAEPSGRAWVWRRLEGRLRCELAHFRPWLLASHLQDFPQGELSADPEAPLTYQELGGPEGSLRYLIQARDGLDLSALLERGIARRLGRRLRLGQLSDYYQVGWVEQYLMQSGRTYYQGLTFPELRRLQLDLETTALDPGQGRIFLAALSDASGWQAVLEAPGEEDEAALIAGLVRAVQQRDPDIIENHNLMGFDLPFLVARAARCRVPLALGRSPRAKLLQRIQSGRKVRYSLAGRELLDTLDATYRMDFVVRALPSHSLKDVARFFGVAPAGRVYLEGAQVHATYRSDPELVRRYALQDVLEVEQVSKRLHTGAFALAKMAPRRLERVAYAGTATGILEPLLVRAYLQAGKALPAKASSPGGLPHAGGAVTLFASGVAERVVKADVASLYPSLIRSRRLGPSSDRLGAFVGLVDQLTALRLRHKAQAQRQDLPAEQRGEHEAMQAAIKLLINSAYGYLGAGELAWFADRAAADMITKLGRETLEQICAGLQAAGATLIEADTDGVYFCVPAELGEAGERALVSQVGRSLPEGLQLELDGRYAAMYSYEVKNYALLGYDGRLTVRGGALRSARAERFAVAWLHRALGQLLRGDLAGLQEGYLRARRALREKALPLEDLVLRTRVTKSPSEYTASGRKEAAYQALLGAARSWQPGDRVAIYRSQAGWQLWEEGGELPGYDLGHYLGLLRSYAERLRKAFHPDDFEQIFGSGQAPLLGRPLSEISPLRI